MSYCKKHGRVNHYKRGDGPPRCGKCAYLYIAANRVKKIDRLADKFNTCKMCGYKGSIGTLNFYYPKRPYKKADLLKLQNLNRSFEKLEHEAEKCILLCNNCHIKTTGRALY